MHGEVGLYWLLVSALPVSKLELASGALIHDRICSAERAAHSVHPLRRRHLVRLFWVRINPMPLLDGVPFVSLCTVILHVLRVDVS